ncbi:hypothetical protein FNW02_08230 [Komarekiella sp. 'clone 1']|uniref:Uncharacterized protein n=1 Tax=Komarekiella delphini-convector SJRDD-AB1 TaxID=2593771 RepID=A0AA40SV26_9NOST|nr:hypothetical protein [Komarekiella delphini-convector SJRDD-AB1]
MPKTNAKDALKLVLIKETIYTSFSQNVVRLSLPLHLGQSLDTANNYARIILGINRGHSSYKLTV